jgi:RNA recognition motif-containing protein
MNIYVGNLIRSVTEEQLRDLFGAYGEVASVRIIKDRETGMVRGFAFVEMKNNDEAQAAIDALNGQDFEGRTMRVNEAQEREQRAPRRTSFGGPRGGGDRGGDRGGFGGSRGGDRGGFGGNRGGDRSW